jgi:hypothetical protein
MKLKNLTATTEDRLKRFDEYVNTIDFDKNTYKSKYLIYKDENGFYLNSSDEQKEDDVKTTIINLVNKYWKEFESGIDLHRYDEDYFIEIKQESDNTYIFIIESLDDDNIYCKFDSNFIVNL